jgi:hypothetical protein
MAQPSTSFILSMSNLHNLITAVPPKLNSKNYLVWRMTILPLIQNLKLMNHLTHDPPEATTTDESNKEVLNPKYEEWQSTDLLLRSWITGTLSEEALGHIVGQNTAREVWCCLKDTYLQATKEREVQLKRQLQVPKPESTSLGDYLTVFKSICDNLAAIQKPISNEDKTVQLSHCLGKKYDVFVTTMLSKPPFPTFSQFVTALQGYDMRYGSVTNEENEGFNPNSNLAFFGQRNGGRGRGSNRGRNQGSFFNSRGRGFAPANHASTQYGRGFTPRPNHSSAPFHNNNAVGHSIQQKGHSSQQNFSRSNQQQSHSNSAPQCQICGRAGHIAVKCWYRYDYSYDTNDNSSQAFAATTISDPLDSDPNWYTDTGANSHMTPNPGNLDDPQSYTGNDHVMVGNGSRLSISHIGNTTLDSSHGKLELQDVLVVPNIKKNLISVSKLTKDLSCAIEFISSGFKIKDRITGQILATGHKHGGLYALHEGGVITALAAIRSGQAPEPLWHQRLGHPHSKFLHNLASKKNY